MANVYSGILNGTMDAFASIISNNMNIVMKVLAIITIVMSIPTIVFSAYGMNVAGSGMPLSRSPLGFLIIILFLWQPVLWRDHSFQERFFCFQKFSERRF